MNIEDRPTPESDAERKRLKRSKSYPSEPVDVDFARNLERQKAALWEALEDLLPSIPKQPGQVGYARDSKARATLAATKPTP